MLNIIMEKKLKKSFGKKVLEESFDRKKECCNIGAE
jgi:hypothetical protein